jgi:hypothetical protein
MLSKKLLATSLLAILATACANTQPTDPAPTPPAPLQTPHRVLTSTAMRVRGDLVPSRIVALAIPKPTERATLGGAEALSVRKVFVPDMTPEASPQRDFRRVMKGTDASAFTFPVDAPVGARVMVRSLDKTVGLATVHLVNVATGKRLDRARDAESALGLGMQVEGSRTPVDPSAKLRAHPFNEAARPKLTPIQTAPLKALPLPGTRPVPSALETRQIAFDLPSTPGLVRLEVTPEVAAAGVIVEIQQPNSAIGLSIAASAHNYGFGESAEVTFTLADDTTPIDGATFQAWGELPNHERTPDFTVTSLGGGKYLASVPLASADPKYIGAWGVHVKATGTVAGVAFERDAETAFGYYPAHARMTALGTPEIIRGKDGSIDDIKVDVDVETLSDDRFTVRGTLTFTGADGQEHTLASAQTGQVVNAGSGTITLHFSADAIAPAQVDGPFHLRDVALVSQAFAITQHRLGLGLELHTDPIVRREIRFPRQLSIQAQELVANGDLPPPPR